MDVTYINPFIEAVAKTYETMLETSVTRGDCRVTRTRDFSPIEITAVIGISGRIRGTVALAFSSAVAVSCVSKLLGMEIKCIDATVVDGIAELVNIIAGDAKARLTEDDAPPLTLSLPAVVRGRDYVIDHPHDTIWLTVPFKSDLGAFVLRVTLSGELTAKRSRVAHAAAEPTPD